MSLAAHTINKVFQPDTLQALLTPVHGHITLSAANKLAHPVCLWLNFLSVSLEIDALRLLLR